ncbi:MAG TPA: amidase [Clostridia bacterium]|nr:amidase [Clostridia bacterium]
MRKAILDWDATTLAEKIRNGEVSVTEATETYIRQLKTVNPRLNVLVENRFAEALAEAKQCDDLLKEGRAQGRLFGVPISMKECFDVAGMHTTGGLTHRKNFVATEDAVAVARLKREGAIILGKTNTPALCFCQETVNKLYGRTNNPWDVSRTCGGSSGGEGALMAVGGAAVGFGGDIGGSIRFPSHCNGVVGFKSGNGQVPGEGHFPPITQPLQVRMLGLGAIAKSVDDAELINEIVADRPPPDLDLDGFTVTVYAGDPRIPLGEETAACLQQITGYFKQDYPVDHTPPPFLHQVSLMWQLIMSYDENGEFVKASFGDRPFHPVWEYLREVVTGTSPYHRYLTWALIGAALFRPRLRQMAKLRLDLAKADEAAREYFAQRVLVLPVYHRTAPPHGGLFREIFSIKRTFLKYMPFIALANVLGLPALTVPVGTDGQGLPIGVQLISAVGNEKALFHFGRLLEREFRGYVRCTKYDS